MLNYAYRLLAIEVAGGIDIIQKTIAAVNPPSVQTTVVVDLHTYDGWPALACLEAWRLSLSNCSTNCLSSDIQRPML